MNKTVSKKAPASKSVNKAAAEKGAVKAQNTKAKAKNQKPKDSPQRIKNSKAVKSQNLKADAKKVAKTQPKKDEGYGDIVQGELVKRTLMVAAFPAMVKAETKDGKKSFLGFLPGFEFCSVDDAASIGECMQSLQDKLDDEIESLILRNEGLPPLPDDEGLLKAYPGFEIKMLDINVWALADDGCGCGCGCEGEHDECSCGCGCGDDCDDDCGCGC